VNRTLLCCTVFATTSLALTGCENDPDTMHEPDNSAHDNTARDNTGVNERDRNAATKTPFDQAENGPDIKITAEIRRAVVSGEGPSTNAENIKIMTEAGVVTLRGPVASEAEKAAIEAAALTVVGVARVDNQLDVQPQ